MSELSLSSMDRLLRKNGAGRVSESACLALANALEERAEKIAKKAVKYASHAGRKTIIAQDIELAKNE